MKTEVLVEMLPIFEGRTSWMYLDSDGTVTVGVGHALFAMGNAVHLFGTTQAGTEWTILKQMTPGDVAEHYQTFTHCRLTDAEIDELLQSDLAAVESQLAALWPVYRTLPEGPKYAVLDMAFNLGTTKLLREFPKCISALAAGDWKTAAHECIRTGVQPERNEWTKACLLSAAEREG